MHGSGSRYRDALYVPIKANLTPLSAPLSPWPRKGSITPGVSKAYTSGSIESFNLVDKA